jgi:hypothetical protein
MVTAGGSIVATIFHRKGRSPLYVRVFVPVDLKPLVGREELSKSTGTADRSTAQCRGKFFEAKASRLWLTLRRSPNMDMNHVKTLVAKFINESLDEWERSTTVEGGLDSKVHGQWQDALTAFSQDRVKELTNELREGIPVSIDPSEFIQRYNLPVAPGSTGWKRLQRELAKAELVIAAKIAEQVQGAYGDEYRVGVPSTGSGLGNLERGLSDLGRGGLPALQGLGRYSTSRGACIRRNSSASARSCTG